MARVLVIRFSSMGDVLLTAPVIVGALNSNPELEIDLLTKKQFAEYFTGIDRLRIIKADTHGHHKGIRGIYRLYKEISRDKRPDMIIDLHSVLRSYLLSLIFKSAGIKFYRINKGRNEKREYLRGKIKHKLRHTVERYSDIFNKAGMLFKTSKFPFPVEKPVLTSSDKLNIGIAPFARHITKSWPLDYVLALMNILNDKLDVVFHIYGGKDDFEKLKYVDFDQMDVRIHAGRLSPVEELEGIAKMGLFISMDSANMHLADLLGIPVYSIWGSTHPDLGFRPLNQVSENAIQTEELLECRPCSVFGNKPCKLKESELKCLLSIKPETVAEKILSSILG